MRNFMNIKTIDRRIAEMQSAIKSLEKKKQDLLKAKEVERLKRIKDKQLIDFLITSFQLEKLQGNQ